MYLHFVVSLLVDGEHAVAVARFLRDVAELRRPLGAHLAVESLNGAPSVVAVFEATADPRVAAEVALGVALDEEGRVAWVWSVLGPTKLARVLGG